MSWVQLTVAINDADKALEAFGQPEDGYPDFHDPDTRLPTPPENAVWLNYSHDDEFDNQQDNKTGYLFDAYIPFTLKWNEIDGIREAGMCVFTGDRIAYVRTDMHHQIVVGMNSDGQIDEDEVWVSRDFLQLQGDMPKVFLGRKPDHAQPMMEFSVWEDIPF